MSIDVLVRKILKGMEYKEMNERSIWINTNETYQEFFHFCHGDLLPDDFRYKMIHDILCQIDDDDDIDDIELNELIPIYTYELINWLDTSISRLSYCDEYLEEFGEIKDTISLLSGGYYQELNEVYHLVIEWLNDNSEEDDD